MGRSVHRNNSGIILITVLWIVAILSLLALSLSKNSSLELLLIRNNVGELKAYAAARAGISYAQGLLSKTKSDKDSLYQCGVKIPSGKKPQDLFKNVEVGQGTHFDILIPTEGYGLRASSQYAYGIEDEQGKININAIDTDSYKVFSVLLQNIGLSDTLADSIAAAVVDWHSDTQAPFQIQNSMATGAKDQYYLEQPVGYKCKNKPFDRVEELLLVKGMTKDIFVKIKDDVTVYPQIPLQGFKVNFKTASDKVIQAVIKGYTVGLSSDDVAQSMIDRRNGADKLPFTSDDGANDPSDVSASQQLYINALEANQGVNNSEYFRIHSVGTDEATGIRCSITAIVNRAQGQEDVNLVSWHRE